MLIGWCNDIRDGGGGEITGNTIYKASPFDSTFVTPEKFNTSCDAYILNNFRRFTKEQLLFIQKSKKPYIIYWHDVLPTGVELSLLKKITKDARLNIFLSPLHRSEFLKKYNFKETDINNCIIPPPVNTKRFFYEGEHKTTKVLWIGNIYPHKGIDNALIWAKKNRIVIDFYGNGHPMVIEQLKQSRYANYLGIVNYNEIHKFYKSYEFFLHLPEKIEACGRSCAEALLSGCILIHNEKLGLMSYGVNFNNKKAMIKLFDGVEKIFWNRVKGVIE